MEHRTWSPYRKKSNDKAESPVKTTKALLRKKKDGDHFRALLDHGTTLGEARGTNVTQRFLNRRPPALLPTNEKLLTPKVSLNWRMKSRA